MIEGYEIVKGIDVGTALKKFRDTYNTKGKYLGWDSMHNHYSMTLGSNTDWTGFPRSGKSQVLQEALLNTSMWYGWQHLIYFPDVGTHIEVIADLLHKKTGKCFDPKMGNTISDAEITNEIAWLTHHFFILTKKDVKAKMTPVEFWDYAVELKKEHTDLMTASIDAWKDMNHPYKEFGGYGQYLEYVLPYRNHIAEEHNMHLHCIVHPKETEKVNGKRKPPTPFDMKGGPEWFNSGKCMITVHRESMSDTRVEIYFNKIKPRSAGKTGFIQLWFDEDTLTYYDRAKTDGQLVSLYASQQGVNLPQKPKKKLVKKKEQEGTKPSEAPKLAFK